MDELKDLPVQVVQIPDAMDPDEYLQKNSPEDLAYLLSNTRISPIEFISIITNLVIVKISKHRLSSLRKIAPLIVKEPSITAQNTYIHLLTDHLPSFDYQQVEHIINESRVRQRQEKVKQVVNPTPITMSVSKQLTAVMRAEAHILYRMMEHPLVLNDYRLRDDFVFETPEFQTLYGLLIDNGSISSEDLANQTREVENAWYQVLALDLPSEMSPEELKRSGRVS